MSLPESGTSLELARSLEMKNQRATQETFTRISFSGKLESFHEQLVGHSCVALQLAFQDDYVSTIKSVSILQSLCLRYTYGQGTLRRTQHPSSRASPSGQQKTRYWLSWTAHMPPTGRTFCHPCSGISVAWTQRQIPCWKWGSSKLTRQFMPRARHTYDHSCGRNDLAHEQVREQEVA
jgi:hypothetical protein